MTLLEMAWGRFGDGGGKKCCDLNHEKRKKAENPAGKFAVMSAYGLVEKSKAISWRLKSKPLKSNNCYNNALPLMIDYSELFAFQWTWTLPTSRVDVDARLPESDWKLQSLKAVFEYTPHVWRQMFSGELSETLVPHSSTTHDALWMVKCAS